MAGAQKPIRPIDIARCKAAYAVELARGASFICSTLTSDSLRAAIAEVVNGFRLRYGASDLNAFREALAQKLDSRGCSRGASEVRNLNGRAVNRESTVSGKATKTMA
jgi:hypothetical protein